MGVPMGYQYDILIRSRRNAETLRWIRKHFLPLLELQVGHEQFAKFHQTAAAVQTRVPGHHE